MHYTPRCYLYIFYLLHMLQAIFMSEICPNTARTPLGSRGSSKMILDANVAKHILYFYDI
jgi:hypothetical protein